MRVFCVILFVPEDRTALARGQDVQLERAIREVEQRIQKKPQVRAPHPGYEKR